jgi:hypothetical protein
MAGFKGKISGYDLVRSLADQNLVAWLPKEYNISDRDFVALQGQMRKNAK